MKKALLLYYSQAGQTEMAIEIFRKGLSENLECDVLRIESEELFAFPWSMTRFFRAFPRCVMGRAPKIKPLNVEWSRYDLVILGYQVWFLSPSLPVQGFLASPQAQGLCGKPVITLLTCRNLFHSALLQVRDRLVEIGADFRGQITLCELSPVWASFVTTPRWMLTGRKTPFWFFPMAGISPEEFLKLEAKGQRIGRIWGLRKTSTGLSSEFGSNRAELSLLLMDRIGHRFFKFWAAGMLKVAPREGFVQDLLLVLFRFNLIALILTLAPCTKIFQYLVGNNEKWRVRVTRQPA